MALVTMMVTRPPLTMSRMPPLLVSLTQPRPALAPPVAGWLSLTSSLPGGSGLSWDSDLRPDTPATLQTYKDHVYFLILDYLLIFFKINYLLLIFLLNWVGAVAVNISDITLVKVRSDAFLRWSDFMSRHQLWLRQSPSLASSPTAGFNRNRGENWFLLIKVSSEQDLITKCTAAEARLFHEGWLGIRSECVSPLLTPDARCHVAPLLSSCNPCLHSYISQARATWTWASPLLASHK